MEGWCCASCPEACADECGEIECTESSSELAAPNASSASGGGHAASTTDDDSGVGTLSVSVIIVAVRRRT